MRPALVVASASALLAAATWVSACSSVLGLGDFTDQKADASANGGSAGIGGSGGATGDSGPTGGSGGATGGSGGAMGGSGGAMGGSGGSAPDAGPDSGDAGPSIACTDGEVFDALVNSDTNGHAGNVFAVGNGTEAYVVMGTDDRKRVLVQSVTDHPGSRRGNKAVVDVAGSMTVTGAQISASTLHVTGYGDYKNNSTWESIDLSFDLTNSLAATPDKEDLAAAPSGCPEIRRAFYVYDSVGVRHSAVSCLEDASGPSTGPMHLYVDGTPVGTTSTPNGTWEVNHFEISNGQYVVLTGEGPGEARLLHAAVNSPANFSSPVEVKFEATAPVTTWPMAAWDSTGGTSLLVLEVDVSGGGLSTPATLWHGVFSNLDDVAQTPPPSMTAIQQALKPADITKFYLYGKPSKIDIGEVVAGFIFPAENSVVYGLFSADGTPLSLGRPVAQASGKQVFPDVASGSLDGDPLIVWNVSDGTTSLVEGQSFHCLMN